MNQTAPQSLKTIYQVLKFAAKHKAPLNRSALTYWEENIPSRLDLGKSRYGGPFTTEQVEDVKTFFKMLTIFLPVFILLVAFDFKNNTPAIIIPGLGSISSHFVYLFCYSPWVWVMVTTVIKEFVYYPMFNNKLPSILTCIGIITFFMLAVRIGYLIVSVVNFFHPLDNVLWHWPSILSYVIYGLISQLIFTKLFEFVCAQSPYNMRGLLTGYVGFLYFSAVETGNFLDRTFFCHESYCPIVRNATTTGLCLIGSIIYCILARWYKLRVRDEVYNPHQVVEEIYDRYLSNQ